MTKPVNITPAQLASVGEALSLMRSMIFSGEDFTEKSTEVVGNGFTALAQISKAVEESAYNAKPASEKPQCVAMVANGYGDFRRCDRSAAYNSFRCYSHNLARGKRNA